MLDTEFPSCFDWSPGTIEGDVIVPETVELDGKVYTVVMIGYGAFYGCDKLKSVKIPSTVRIISNNVFYGCESLESVDIDLETPRYIAPYTDMLQYINKKELDLSNWDSVSFCYGDDSVEVLKLPKIHPDWLIMPVRYLMLGRFSNLRELWSFHEDPVSVMPLDVWDNPDEEYISLFERVTVYVPKGSAEKYRNAYYWQYYKNIVEMEAGGVEDIEMEKADEIPVYYNLQGQQIAEPDNGVYIRRQGNKAEKVLIQK